MEAVSTRMMVDVAAPGEATGGADIVTLAAALGEPALRSLVAATAGRCRSAARAASPEQAALAWACGVDMVIHEGTGDVAPEGELFALRYADQGVALEDAAALARAGYAGVLMEVSPTATGRLLRHAALTELQGFAQACRAHGLAPGFAGGLELPDIPRLLLLHPALLGVRGGPARLGQFRALIAPPSAPAATQGDTDRIFVHDLVLPVRIGAYAHERAAPQTMRFSVDATITRPTQPVRDMRDIISYDIISDSIRLLAASAHVDLVEMLAERIAASVLAHPRVVKVSVTLEKLETGSGRVGVVIERSRPSMNEAPP